MATVTSKVLARAAAATTNTTLYTVPASTTSIITNIAVTNTSAIQATFTLNLNAIPLVYSATIAPFATTFIDLKQVLATTQTLTGSASAITVYFHVSGVEIV